MEKSDPQVVVVGTGFEPLNFWQKFGHWVAHAMLFDR